MRLETLRASLEWAEIPNCPGRYVLRTDHAAIPPGRLVGGSATTRFCHSPHAADPIELVMLEDGALLSYRKPDGRYVHTLNTARGLARKLAQLELTVQQPRASLMRSKQLVLDEALRHPISPGCKDG